uniref:Protein kinase domain-containing protein n=1 Tax=Chromera velia CCMP2878 TaxID=1169474 RepID=A0A0G4FLL8_9ALVE|eukprot:Cvel_17649.t1-p1 / transcript=Cvel_17649.t1 / gene=Cvel_17649 / organism=Chromera_velia_CCMP2878 / gene_product=hypothetical protein / transcript_product=hypothetical protein / location=Cvel_scaffold1421:30616-31497(+) / protein_length=294 / sequence_SO=supercontig / SO=protein_coding / is_pseudo=false
MSRLEDVRASGVFQKGKEVVGGIVKMCGEVGRRLREVGGLGSLLGRTEKEVGEISQVFSLYENGGAERERVNVEELLSSPLTALKGLLEEHEEQMNTEKELELETELARLRRKGEEVRRLENELQRVRETSKGRDLPAAIARERARLMSFVSRHFPELLWEGGSFLHLVRLDVQEVVRAEAPSMLERGVLVQGRFSLRDFSNEAVISAPSPQSGRFARVTACTDLQGGQWVLKRYEIGRGGEEPQSLSVATGASRHFYREAAMLQELQHLHLVHVTEVWQEGVYGFVWGLWVYG